MSMLGVGLIVAAIVLVGVAVFFAIKKYGEDVVVSVEKESKKMKAHYDAAKQEVNEGIAQVNEHVAAAQSAAKTIKTEAKAIKEHGKKIVEAAKSAAK